MNNGIISALDIGSTKICCFIGEADEQDVIRVTGIGHQASQGVRAGLIVPDWLPEAAPCP